MASLAPKTLGEALRLLIERAGYARERLARDVGVSAGSLSNYAHDVSVPSLVVARRLVVAIASRLGSNADELWLEIGHLIDDVTPSAGADYALDVQAQVIGRIDEA